MLSLGALALDVGRRPLADRRRAVPDAAQTAVTRAIDGRPPTAHPDAVRLAVQLRAALAGAERKSLLFCGVVPGQTVHRLLVEVAYAFVELQYVPLLLVELEPGTRRPSHADLEPPETDAITWLHPGAHGRDAAAIVRLRRRRASDSPGYLSASAFADDLACWAEPASAVLCGARAITDSISTLTAATACHGAVLVVPKGAPAPLVTSACETFRQAGVALVGCVLDQP